MEKYFLLYVLIIFFGLFSVAQRPAPKGKLFIIGGGSRGDVLMDRIIAESGLHQGGYAIVLPMSSEEPDSSVFYAKQSFLKKGIRHVYGLHFVMGDGYGKQKLDSIRRARLIYIPGGDQSRFMRVVKGTEIERAIHEAYEKGSVVAGTSAGAAVMSDVMITGNELKYPAYTSTFQHIEADNIETSQGLGLIENVIIDQHFIVRSRHNRLISAVIEFPERKCIGIDESTALLVHGTEAEVVGESQVIMLENPDQSRKIQEGKLGAAGLKLTVFLPGDKFQLR